MSEEENTVAPEETVEVSPTEEVVAADAPAETPAADTDAPETLTVGG